MEVFEEIEECMMHCTDSAIHLFCSKDCRDQWVFPVTSERECAPEELTPTYLMVQRCRYWSLTKNVQNAGALTDKE